MNRYFCQKLKKMCYQSPQKDEKNFVKFLYVAFVFMIRMNDDRQLNKISGVKMAWKRWRSQKIQ